MLTRKCILEVIRNLPGTGACDFEIQSVERSGPGCSLHQGASLWNDAPAGVAPGTRLCKLRHWTLSPSHTRQVLPVTARTGKRRNGHRLQGFFQGRNSYFPVPAKIWRLRLTKWSCRAHPGSDGHCSGILFSSRSLTSSLGLHDRESPTKNDSLQYRRMKNGLAASIFPISPLKGAFHSS